MAIPAPGVALRAIDAFEGVSSSAFLDRLIRGRLWIGLLAFALIGIVAMQLLVLKLNTGIGRTLEHAATLQRENAQLGIEDSTYSAEGRVAPLAAAQGMTLAPSGAVHFVVAGKADIARAAATLSAASQTPASSVTTSESSTSTPSSEAQTQTSTDAASQASGSSGEAGEDSGSLGPSASSEAAAGSSEASASPATSATPEATVGSTSQAANAAPDGAAQQAGAPTTPSSSEISSGTTASGAAGGTQAGVRE